MAAIEPQLNVHQPSVEVCLDATNRVAIKYINQPIPSPCVMVDYDSLVASHSLSNVLLNHDNILMHVVSTPCLEGEMVNFYLKLIDYKDALVKQRNYFSGSETYFKYISKEHKGDAADAIAVLAKNRTRDGLYSLALSFQDHAILCWSGKKDNGRLFPLPTKAEAQTTT